MKNCISLSVGLAFCLYFVTAAAQAQNGTIFQIGKQDRSFMEFTGHRKPGVAVVFQAGKSTLEDWDAYQPGTLDYQVGRSDPTTDWIKAHPAAEGGLAKDPVPVPFQVDFELPAAPQGKFILRLDAIFRYQRPAAPWYVVEVNGHTGRYRLSPQPAPELWWPVGPSLDVFIGYESLEMPMPSSYFKAGTNHVAVRCEGGFGIYYDDLSLRQEPGETVPPIVSAALEPTIFYKTGGAGLLEVAKVRIRTTRPLGRKLIRAEIGSSQVEQVVDQADFGDVEATIEVPAPEEPVAAVLSLAGESAAIFRGSFVPAKRWKIYAMPAAQATFGYAEVPARTIEFESRYIDKVLEILKEHPSYSFTLDAASNLDYYLATRNEAHGRQLLDYLRNGKLGINALYLNYFTGLATAEEHFHVLDYAMTAARKHNFPLDSASQTDEPSVTWALPQVLSAANIKYFALGSDPIRGPFNPIGQLNFKSPFYWEGPNGDKVLMWSAVHYIGLKDMTWEGWNLEAVQSGTYSPSTFGLSQSLPLFLSQYERQQYPLDAVFLYGLQDDENPIRHHGDADIVEMWNKEYAYPQMIPATQRDFFTYVTDHFGSQLKTYRGDGGAYWEDEAGSDARIAAINRTSQTQILAAEKFESVANWLQPLLRFDYEPFRAAWDNIMLTDSYVWSDAQSLHRPYSYRTRAGEAAHRAWGEAGLQQSWDLRTRAMDKMAELVRTDGFGAVVFNTESWPHAGYFDFELEPDEVLVDPATKEKIPCGSMRSLDGYQDVRCWANQVPPLGYKFYSIAKGKVPAGEPVAPGTTVEGRYYRLQLDPHSGAISHLIDKETGKDLVNARTGFQMNEYLYVTGGDPTPDRTSNRLLSADATLPVPELIRHRPTVTAVPAVRRYPWGISVTIRARATNTPRIVTTIILSENRKLITIQNEIEKTATLKKEGVYFAFPFAVKKPRVSYQGATAWVNPETDMLPGANRQWFTTHGGVFVEGQDDNVGWVSVDAPLITLEDINRGLWPDGIEVRQGTVFSYAMNNYWDQDAPAQQGGNFTFRYALTSGPNLSIPEVDRLAVEQRAGLPTIRHAHKQWQQTLPENGEGLLSTSPVGVRIQTIKPGLDPDTYLIRVSNSSPQEVQAGLHFSRAQLSEAYLGSVVGERAGSVDWSAHEIMLPMKQYDIKTLVVRVKMPQE